MFFKDNYRFRTKTRGYHFAITVICTVFVSFSFYTVCERTVCETEQFYNFKMSKARTSKHIKCKDLSLADKILVIDELEKKTPQSTVAKKFGISQSQVSRILKSKENLFSAHRSNKNPNRKRARKSTQEDVEDALLQWFKQAKSKALRITGPMLRKKAKNFGKIMNLNFDLSSSWVTRWRECNLIVFKRRHGEKQDHDSEAAENWIASVWPKIY